MTTTTITTGKRDPSDKIEAQIKLGESKESRCGDRIVAALKMYVARNFLPPRGAS
jgi:hypothetical protein